MPALDLAAVGLLDESGRREKVYPHQQSEERQLVLLERHSKKPATLR
jgi:hypothetical protein